MIDYRYTKNGMIQSTTGLTPNGAHRDKNSIIVQTSSVMTEKYLSVPGAMFEFLCRGKGNCTSRKEYRSQWSERTYEVE